MVSECAPSTTVPPGDEGAVIRTPWQVASPCPQTMFVRCHPSRVIVAGLSTAGTAFNFQWLPPHLALHAVVLPARPP
jgi:hypothetical protein